MWLIGIDWDRYIYRIWLIYIIQVYNKKEKDIESVTWPANSLTENLWWKFRKNDPQESSIH